MPFDYGGIEILLKGGPYDGERWMLPDYREIIYVYLFRSPWNHQSPYGDMLPFDTAEYLMRFNHRWRPVRAPGGLYIYDWDGPEVWNGI